MDREHNLVGFASLRVLCGEKLFFSSGGSGHEDLHAALKTQLLVLHDFTDQKLFFLQHLGQLSPPLNGQNGSTANQGFVGALFELALVGIACKVLPS